MRHVWLLALAVAGFAPAPHDFHVSYGRIAIEGSVVQARIRFFRNDLQETLRAFSGDESLELSASPLADSVFTAYAARRFVLTAGADTLRGAIVDSGDAADGRESVWWYVVAYEAPRPVVELGVTSTLLFDLFDDQSNIVKIQHFPSEQLETWYLTPETPRQTFRVK